MLRIACCSGTYQALLNRIWRMGMDRIDADFTVLQELADRIERDPNNAGWYMHRAYMLGRGCDVNEALEMPPRDYSKPMLKLIMGGKNG